VGTCRPSPLLVPTPRGDGGMFRASSVEARPDTAPTGAVREVCQPDGGSRLGADLGGQPEPCSRKQVRGEPPCLPFNRSTTRALTPP